MDVFPQELRRKLMARVRNRHTGPERAFRSALHRRGLRFRLHPKGLPGTPDFVLPKYRTAVFVHGCFWHGHDCPRGRAPATNRDFWEAKRERNRARDAAAEAALAALGWKVVVVWTCRIAGRAALEAEADALAAQLRRGAVQLRRAAAAAAAGPGAPEAFEGAAEKSTPYGPRKN